MVVLAAETSTSINTVALCRDDKLLGEVVVDCGRRHSERLLDEIQWLLAETEISFSQIDLLAVSVGPGSFTGLRIGVATMKGLAFSRDLPLAGVSSLQALARAGGPRRETVHTLLDARMREVFYASFDWRGQELERRTADAVGPIGDALANLCDDAFFLGDGAPLYEAAIRECCPAALLARAGQLCPRASAVATEGLALAAQGLDLDPGKANPVYLRASQAEMNQAKAREKLTSP